MKKKNRKKRKKHAYIITSFYFSFKLAIIITLLIIYNLFCNISNNNIHKNFNQIKTFKENNNSFNGTIFVSFMYNNEAEMAYIHLWRLYDYVDKFIL